MDKKATRNHTSLTWKFPGKVISELNMGQKNFLRRLDLENALKLYTDVGMKNVQYFFFDENCPNYKFHEIAYTVLSCNAKKYSYWLDSDKKTYWLDTFKD